MSALLPPAERRVFISHVHDDAALAQLLRSYLEQPGVRVWSADQIAPGERWAPAIREAIAEADDVVFLLSDAALSSPSVSVEIGAAVAAAETANASNKRLIPVVLGDARPTGILSSYQWLRASRRSPGEIADLVSRALAAPVTTNSKSSERADELDELRRLEVELAALRSREVDLNLRRSRLLAGGWIVLLALVSVATGVALLAGADIGGSAIATTLSATLGLLGTMVGFYYGREARSHDDD